jgi:hypothetical protein
MTNKIFSIAGYSKLGNGQYKARFANTSVKARTALLERGGQTDVVFIDLPEKMSKVAAAQYVLDAVDNLPPAAGVALKHVLVTGTDEVSVTKAVSSPTATKTKSKSKTTATA